MSSFYLTRARLSADFRRLGPILFPGEQDRRMALSHRLVWTLFSETATERPFLYREMDVPGQRPGQDGFIILSREAPEDRMGLFTLDTKPFAPVLKAGDRLGFSLRANPSVQTSEDENGKRKTRRHDVVMRALHAIPAAERAEARPRLIREQGLAWLSRQAEKSGFSLPDPDGVAIDGYEQFDVDPENRRRMDKRGRKRAVHSRLDFSGVLRVEEPEAFLARVVSGFGRARAFGHGLMLLRRA
ncbi:type I-E CRISPR-associated protein Cas6/Cse3/CasE [Rhizobium paknamense]|uniref:CRISPR system Cascade subunit CasE n=1 Tax=Rhizobium paknamense TaxID=1206817 RepID=A0ABU0IDF7_9HYPH|nr:type I-E CRISPR-associated protein Cas6/Cse3/CasE [Rhizobium paknamense]MDQ0455722.1 CRISPR system Cascade subunit CasE [Rhizobium paknamense]